MALTVQPLVLLLWARGTSVVVALQSSDEKVLDSVNEFYS